ncbi:MAG TPA: aminopeptidase P family protein [Bacteroidales bacterium]|nr:aminopeptidase P family protein [Bacteroidales bacterium]
MNYKERLALIRSALKNRKIDAFIIPNSDPHLGTNLVAHWRIIEWISGFTGSAGTLVITKDFYGLWTDSRYLIQAEYQLRGLGISVLNIAGSENQGWMEWLSKNLEKGNRIAIDGRIMSISQFKRLENLVNENNLTINFESDLISELWTDRPVLPDKKAFNHEVKYSGRDRLSKINEVRKEMHDSAIDYQLLASPDDIMWLLNIRGGDLEFSPLLLSFAILSDDQILLFADENKIPLSIAHEFDKLGIVILPYEEIYSVLSAIETDTSLLVSPTTTSAMLYRSIPEGVRLIEDLTIPAKLKAVKNEVEIEGLSKCMLRDGTALTKFFYNLEKIKGSQPLTEITVTTILNRIRAQQENFVGLSFSSIVAYNAHAALPHYSAVPDTDADINPVGILLTDSGSHYFEGTTDITRTICLGEPTDLLKKDFTLVLKGMINLALAKFPSGTYGYQLDILARKALWENGFNYGHGTGHGVGFCLNVHEGPHGISPLAGTVRYPLQPGMVVTDEPGIYRQGLHGIRTENMLLCVEDEVTEFGNFLKFNTLSLCYIDTSLVDISLLEKSEINWLNNYHTVVYEKLSPYLDEDEKQWLRIKTSPLINPALNT